ncbi:hypothetical protein HMPREF0484_3758 [Klebsiella pneumoniae subsp. rhinoscleromatis ATCC 13884]|nr:hypothetical protein HMPREF0484_3758 [Klebsiella pneumoniae subsp. rhinoscleromatis ATCC 13884]
MTIILAGSSNRGSSGKDSGLSVRTRLPVNDEHASKKYYQRQGKGNHSQPVDEETALFLGDRTVSQPAWQPGAMVRLTVSGKARVFSG